MAAAPPAPRSASAAAPMRWSAAPTTRSRCSRSASRAIAASTSPPGSGRSSSLPPHGKPTPAPRRRDAMVIGVAHMQPIVALIAGVLILLMPRILNYIVAIYLIVIGVLGLGLIK